MKRLLAAAAAGALLLAGCSDDEPIRSGGFNAPTDEPGDHDTGRPAAHRRRTARTSTSR